MAERETWHPLKPKDARNLTAMLAQFNSRSLSGQKRMHMTLYLWSRLWDERDGVPYFNCGRPTIANACGISQKTVQKYLEQMEECGWIVRLSDVRRGQRIKRTFAWLADENEQSRPLEGSPHDPKYLQKGSRNLTPEQGKRGHHNMEHVNRADDTTSAPDGACGVTAEPLINAVTGEAYDPSPIDPHEIGEPIWMRG